MELIINNGLLNRLSAIKERQTNEMTKAEFHFYRIDEIRFKKCKIHIQKQLNQMIAWQQ